VTTLVRLLPPVDVRYQTMTVNGRTYSAAPGATVDVADYDANVLSANGWIKMALVGATAARPVNPRIGDLFVDTTIGAIIVSDSKNWRSFNGTSV
jgi:hypothetical protein